MRFKKLLLIIFGIILSLAILEIGLRLAAWIAQSNLSKVPFSNSARLKVLCLGDSYTYGLGVERQQAYPAQLELLLKAKLGKDKIEVINAGRPGMNTPLLASNFCALLDHYQPDIVLIMIGTNDEWNFSGFLSASNKIIDKFYSFIGSFRIIRMFKIFTTSFNQPQNVSPFEVQVNKNKINEIISLIEANGGLNNSYYYQAIMLGNQYRGQNKFEEAKLYYDCALKINSDGALISKELLRYYRKALTVLRDKLKKDNISEILRKVEQGGGLDQAYCFDLIKLGNEYRDQNKFEEAKLYYDYALKINPEDKLLEQELMRYNKRIAKRLNAQLIQDKSEENNENISKYIRSVYLNKEEVEPDNKFALEMIDLSEICRIVSLFEDNLLLLTKTIYLYGFSKEIWEELDELFIAWPYPKNAIEFFQNLLIKYPDNIDIYSRLASQYKRVQDYKQVVRYFKKVLELSPDNQQAIDGIVMANEFIEQGLTKDYVLLEKNEKLFAVINTVLEGGKSKFQADNSANNLIKDPSIALGLSIPEKRYDQQTEEILWQDKNHADLFGKNSSDRDVFVKQRLNKINNLVAQGIKQMCDLAKERRIKTFFLSYPLSVYPTIKETAEFEAVPFIDLRESFTAIITQDNFKEYFLSDGHCTEKGYKIMVDELIQVIFP